jgi:hypothetical protein
MLLAFDDALLIPTSPVDIECRRLADRHYPRQTPGAPEFTGNGQKLILRDAAGLVVFAWLFPNPALRRWDGQVGYNNVIFRNESAVQSSAIILEAEQHAVAKWGPRLAYTYIDPRKVRSVNPGYCFKCAGWVFKRRSSRGKHLLEKELR